jgi:energy-coupling factor transport system ATP-binding protein
MDPIIHVSDVWFRYSGEDESKEDWALQGVHLDVQSGEYIAIIGLNGSGKSTLARMFNGLLIPTEGEVMVAGLSTKNEQDLWEIRRKVGMIFQNPDNQLVATTVQDDVAFGLENLGIPRAEMKMRIQDALQAVGLSGFEKREPHHLSGGQKQRLAIAGTLAMQPDVIVFDEATSMLDPQGRKDVLQLISELHKKGRTIIHITHRADEAFLADRVIVMADGKVKLDLPRLQCYKESLQLLDWGLDVPFAVQLHHRLRKRGFSLSDELTSTEDLVNQLWRLLSKG